MCPDFDDYWKEQIKNQDHLLEKWFVSKDTAFVSPSWEKFEDDYKLINVSGVLEKKSNNLKYILI